jgi:hypothetical protein
MMTLNVKANKVCTSARALSGLVMIGLLAAVMVAVPTAARAGSISVGLSVGIAPPPIPVYTQPPCPAPGYMWTPGYWAYDPANGYFWVPGTWVAAPQPGFLWTPGYWGWGGAAFIWHAGYWGPHIGFYGGVNYGFGYNGVGFVGGEWRHDHFFYNRAVTNFGGRHFDDVYDHPVRNNFAVNRVSYNGGRGGLAARPTPGEMAAEHERHMEANSVQRQHELAAHNDRAQFATVNHGRPGVAATGRPGDFHGGAVAASRAGGSFNNAEFHGTNAGHTNGYSGGRTPTPNGNHPVIASHQNPPAAHPYGNREGGQYHAPPPSHNQAWHGTGANHQPSNHPPQVQEHNAHPSGGAPHGGGGAQHQEKEQKGGESRHR